MYVSVLVLICVSSCPFPLEFDVDWGIIESLILKRNKGIMIILDLGPARTRNNFHAFGHASFFSLLLPPFPYIARYVARLRDPRSSSGRARSVL